MPVLSVSLLGPFEVTKDGLPVAFSYNKVRALLAYLCAEPEQPHPRTRLASLLWPDQAQSSAQDSLRQALSRLRSGIGDHDASPPYLLVERDSLQLNPNSGTVVDLSIFQDLRMHALAHRHRSLLSCAACAAQMEKATVLLRGRFLEDLSLPDSDLFEAWATALRERMQIQAMELLEALAAYAEGAGDSDRTLAHALKQIDIDPYHEPAHRRVMRALVRSGQRSQAAQHFKRLKQMLAYDLGIDPTPETLTLFESIRAGHDMPGPGAPQVRGLPAPLTPLVGREVELNELIIWLADPARRLISIVGPGGVGKTRLAVEAVQRAERLFANGAVYVSIPHSTAGAKAVLGDLVTQAIGGPAKIGWAQVIETMRGRETLLVLDAFENALAERELVTRLLEALPRLAILVTTRERLGLPDEWTFALGGLDTPPPTMTRRLEAYSATALFDQCARQANQDFQINDENRAYVGEICRLVGGLPLAIRLAAAWTRSLICKEIAAEIRRSLDFLSDQAGNSSIRAVFESSWNRLSEEERAVFPRLSVFRGGFDRASAEAVAGASVETLTRLVDQSLVRVTGEGRNGLHDLLHQFGDEKLQSRHETETVRRRHFEYFYQLAEKNEQAFSGADPLTPFMWVIRESANLREALHWAESHEPVQAKMLAAWMHSDFHQTGLHVLKASRQP